MSTPEERAKKAAYMRKWCDANREKVRQTNRISAKRQLESNPEQVRDRVRRWRARPENRAKEYEYRKAREAADPEIYARHLERSRQWKVRNQERMAKAFSEYYAANQESLKAYQRQRRAENPDMARERDRKSKYGITTAQFNEMALKQEGKCLICGTKPKVLHVDHCHSKRIVRGLLCRECNLMLGFAKDNVEILERGIRYLRGFDESPPLSLLDVFNEGDAVVM